MFRQKAGVLGKAFIDVYAATLAVVLLVFFLIYLAISLAGIGALAIGDQAWLAMKAFPGNVLPDRYYTIYHFLLSFALFFVTFYSMLIILNVKVGSYGRHCYLGLRNVFTLNNFVWFMVVLLAMLMVYSCFPDFNLLIKNSAVLYGNNDPDSYVHSIYRTSIFDFDPKWEGAVFFAKYFVLTVPSVLVSFLGGPLGFLRGLNVTVYGLMFLTITNFTCIAVLLLKCHDWKQFATVFCLNSFFVFLSLQFIYFPDNGLNVFLNTISQGYYGALSAQFLFTACSMLFMYIAIYIKKQYVETCLLALLLAVAFMVHDYWHFVLFLMSGVAVYLTLLISNRDSEIHFSRRSAAYIILVAYYVAVYLILDIGPDHNMHVKEKLCIVGLGNIVLLVFCLVVNYRYKNVLYNHAVKYQRIILLGLFVYNFLYIGIIAVDGTRILFFNTTIELFNERLYFYYALMFPFLATVLVYYAFRKMKYALPVSVVLFVSLAVFVNYPSAFGVKDASVVSRNSTITPFYSKEYIDLIRYFLHNKVIAMRFWVLSESPEFGIYEHSLLGKILQSRKHELEGTTLMHNEPEEQWAWVRLSDKPAGAPDFIKNLDQLNRNYPLFELNTRREAYYRFTDRYIIIDKKKFSKTLQEILDNPLNAKVYENARYVVAHLPSVKSADLAKVYTQ